MNIGGFIKKRGRGADGDLGAFQTLSAVIMAGEASSGIARVGLAGASGNVGGAAIFVAGALRYLELNFAELASDAVSIADVSTSTAAPSFGVSGLILSPSGTDAHSVGVSDGLAGINLGGACYWLEFEEIEQPTSPSAGDGVYLGLYSPTGGVLNVYGSAYDGSGNAKQGRMYGDPNAPTAVPTSSTNASALDAQQPVGLTARISSSGAASSGGALSEGSNLWHGATGVAGGAYNQTDWIWCLVAAGAGATYAVRRASLLLLPRGA